MKLVTNKFKSGGLHEKHVVANYLENLKFVKSGLKNVLKDLRVDGEMTLVTCVTGH